MEHCSNQAPFAGVLHNLERNRQQLQHNLAAAAALLPLAHASDGLAKAFQDVPAALAAAAARLGSAAAAHQQQRQEVGAAAGPQQQQLQQQPQQRRRPNHKQRQQQPVGEAVCTEYTKGKRRVYHRQQAAADGGEPGDDSWDIADDVIQHRQRLSTLASDYLLPQGYPDSVAPQYAPYMRARAWQYLFGGALSVFTTRSLLASLGVANKASGEAAAAINWAVKDGAGRLGRFLFARWGRDLDCELKQFRLAGDLLMEAGAALELSTAMVPGAFLPLACTANLAKNLAAVAIVSTRAPIYRTFALRNNLADVTAKGESVANLADVVGTALGIALAKFNLPVVPTFTALSLGYIIASRVEVDTVILPYLNRARLSYVARSFCQTGAVPGLEEGNKQEPIMPWRDPHVGRVVLGATVEEACAGPQQLHEALGAFSGRQYALTYRRDTGKCYALLKEGANTQAVLQAALDAHCLLWMLDSAAQQQKEAAVASVAVAPWPAPAADQPSGDVGGAAGKLHAAVRELGGGGEGGLAGQQAVQFVARSDHFKEFQRQAQQAGWRLHMTSLNPRETRLALA